MPYAGYSNTEQWDQSIIRRFCSSNHWRSQIANLVVPLTRLTQALLLLILLSVGWPARADYWAGIAAFVRSDYQTARAEWQALAEQGHSEARFNLGALYDEGLGVERDYAQAVLWYRRAAEQGHSKAQFNLAVLYANGLGVAVNKTEAARWYQQAANQGQVEAQFNLAVLYEDGDGVPQNDVLAAEWYRQAAQQGHAVAQNNLGILYANGRGMPQDLVLAYAWYTIAVANGNAKAQSNRDQLTRILTPKQLLAGKELAIELAKIHRPWPEH